MKNPFRPLVSWLRSPPETPVPPESIPVIAPLAIRESFRSDLSDLSGDEEKDGGVISEEEWNIQERTRERVEAIRESRDKGFVVQEHTGPGVGDGAREGASLDWDIATTETMAAANDKLSEQKAAWFERGAHHMGSSTTPLLPSPEDARLSGCGRLMRDAGCEWLEPMVRDGFIRPKIESGCRMTLEIVSSGVSVSVDISEEGVSFLSGERGFADAGELESWLREIV